MNKSTLMVISISLITLFVGILVGAGVSFLLTKNYFELNPVTKTEIKTETKTEYKTNTVYKNDPQFESDACNLYDLTDDITVFLDGFCSTTNCGTNGEGFSETFNGNWGSFKTKYCN